MKKLLTSRSIATGLRIYGALSFLIGIPKIVPGLFTYEYSASFYESITHIGFLSSVLVLSLLRLFLYFALAMILEAIVEIGVCIKGADSKQ